MQENEELKQAIKTFESDQSDKTIEISMLRERIKQLEVMISEKDNQLSETQFCLLEQKDVAKRLDDRIKHSDSLLVKSNTELEETLSQLRASKGHFKHYHSLIPFALSN